MRTFLTTLQGLCIGLALGALGGFLYLPVVCTVLKQSYDGMGVMVFTMLGAAGGTTVGGVLSLAIGLVGLLRRDGVKGMPEGWDRDVPPG